MPGSEFHSFIESFHTSASLQSDQLADVRRIQQERESRITANGAYRIEEFNTEDGERVFRTRIEEAQIEPNHSTDVSAYVDNSSQVPAIKPINARLYVSDTVFVDLDEYMATQYDYIFCDRHIFRAWPFEKDRRIKLEFSEKMKCEDGIERWVYRMPK